MSEIRRGCCLRLLGGSDEIHCPHMVYSTNVNDVTVIYEDCGATKTKCVFSTDKLLRIDPVFRRHLRDLIYTLLNK